MINRYVKSIRMMFLVCVIFSGLIIIIDCGGGGGSGEGGNSLHDENGVDVHQVKKYTLTVTTNGQGSVLLNPAGGAYDTGTVVTLTTAADSCWEFSGWGEDLAGSNTPETILMDSDKSVTAIFTNPDSNCGNTSANLIDQALSDGNIDEETALIYKVYAAFGDGRLPGEYKGDDSGAYYNHILDDVSLEYSTLSPEAQKTLYPFFIPPFYEGSWHDLRSNYQSTQLSTATALDNAPCDPFLKDNCPERNDWKSVGGTHVKVWYLERNEGLDLPVAQGLCDFIDNTVWNKITFLMGDPLPDGGLLSYNGGDARLDIALVGLGAKTEGKTVPCKLIACEETPVFILLNRNNFGKIYPASVHEFMHATQFSYNVLGRCVTEYRWLMESTATWAVDFVYGASDQWEQKYAKEMLDVPEKSLDAPGMHMYGAYVFPFFLARTAGNPTQIRSIWDATASKDKLDCLDEGLGGQLENIWKDFARYNWNRDPYDDYKDWDGLTTGAKPVGNDPRTVTLGADDDKEFKMVASVGQTLELPYLSARYFHYDFSDSNVRTVVFYNGFTFKLGKQTYDEFGETYIVDDVEADNRKGAKVQALIKINGQWEHKDWTDDRWQTYCRDLNSENIEELVVIFSYSNVENRGSPYQPPGLVPVLRVSNIGCGDWDGTVDFKMKTHNGGVTETFKIDDAKWIPIVDMADESNSQNGSGLIGTFHQLAAGTAKWTISGQSGSCVYNGSDQFSVAYSSMCHYMNLRFITGGKGYRKIIMMGLDQDGFKMMPYTKTCTDEDGTKVYDHTTVSSFFISVTPDRGNSDICDGGTAIEGDGSDTNGSDVTGTWKFEVQKE